MGKTFKLLTFILISFVLVMGVTGEANAKKKKKAVATEAENALFDKWKVKKKKRSKYVKVMHKSPKFVGAIKCNGSCHDPYYQAWVNSPHGDTFKLLQPGTDIGIVPTLAIGLDF